MNISLRVRSDWFVERRVPEAAVEDERVTGVEQHLDGALGVGDRVARRLGAAGSELLWWLPGMTLVVP